MPTREQGISIINACLKEPEIFPVKVSTFNLGLSRMDWEDGIKDEYLAKGYVGEWIANNDFDYLEFNKAG